MSIIDQAIAALTCDQIERDGCDVTIATPLLDRSIAWELRRISGTLGGSPVLRAIAHSIDEALLALAELQRGS